RSVAGSCVGPQALDRIMIYRKHSLVPINHVNSIYINNLEQIHMVVGSPLPIIFQPFGMGQNCQSFGMGQNGDSDEP
ncbi:MAG: hypothetical protein WD407_06295, partial [Rhodospirillales bacterium]